MVRRWIPLIVLVVAASSCSGAAANCTEYAAEVRARMTSAENGQELMKWLEETSGHAARLIQQGSDGQACADAILEAMFTAGAMEFEAELDSLLSE